MIEEPGSFSGRESSPYPQRGPEPRYLISFAILNNDAARVLRAPEASTAASCAANASNLLGAVENLRPVSLETSSAMALSNPMGALRPVPTAVPP